MYFKIFLVLQVVGIYIGLIFLSYYLLRRYMPSDDTSLDKIASVFWIFTIILLLLNCIITGFSYIVEGFNNILTKVGELANKETKEDEEKSEDENRVLSKDNFSTHFPLVKSDYILEPHGGVSVVEGDVVLTENGLDIGIVAETHEDGSPSRICTIYSPYFKENSHYYQNARSYGLPEYGGIDYINWYRTSLNMSISEWYNLTKRLYEANDNCKDVYDYFSALLNYPIR